MCRRKKLTIKKMNGEKIESVESATVIPYGMLDTKSMTSKIYCHVARNGKA